MGANSGVAGRGGYRVKVLKWLGLQEGFEAMESATEIALALKQLIRDRCGIHA